MDKRADSSEKEKKRKVNKYDAYHTMSRSEIYEIGLAQREYRQNDHYNGLSDARKYVERRGYGEQDYW